MRPWLGLAAAVASGASVAAAFPPSRAPWLAFIAFAPLLWALDDLTIRGQRRATILRASTLGLASGATTTLCGFAFLVEVLVEAAALPPVAAYAALGLLALSGGLGVALVATLAARAATSGLPLGPVFALLYALQERLWPTLLPWSFGAVWLDRGPVAQLAAFVGAPGLTALAILPAASLVALGRAPRSRRALGLVAGSIVLFVGAWWAGEARSGRAIRPPASQASLRVGLVHLEPPRDEARLAELLEASRALEREGAELVVWSEGAVPGLVPTDELEARFGQGLPGVGVPAWVGVVLVDSGGRRWNSALLVSPDGVEARQDKRSLIPFAERTPPWVPLASLGLPRRDFVPGTQVEVAEVDAVRTAATICYEDTLSGGLRALLEASEAELVVNLTHDGWFRHDPKVAERHLLLARLGAIELGRDLVRATEAGVSAWIDATGSVRARTSRGGPNTLLTSPSARAERTPYTAWGDAPLVALGAGALLWAEALLWRGARRMRRARAGRRALSPSEPS